MSYSVSLHLNKSLILIHMMTQYIDIATKLITGMVGILFFLRITGKAQMAQLTPLDTVSAFVIGALVGGVIYSPDLNALHILFALAVWTTFNLLIRYSMRYPFFRRLFKGDSVYLMRGGVINARTFKRHNLDMEQFRVLLRQQGVFSLFDLEDVRFETNGSITISQSDKGRESYLIINNGTIADSSLSACGKSQSWALRQIKHNGFEGPSELFCMEWTPLKGFYFVSKSGNVKRGDEEVTAEEITTESVN